VTDFEHDSAHAFNLTLLGVGFEEVTFGLTTVTAVISPRSSENFKVPVPGYNPMEHADTKECKYYPNCKRNPHLIIPEQFYQPPCNTSLFKIMAGMAVEITFGTPVKEGAEE